MLLKNKSYYGSNMACKWEYMLTSCKQMLWTFKMTIIWHYMSHYVNIEGCFVSSEGCKITSSYIRINVLVAIELCFYYMTFIEDRIENNKCMCLSETDAYSDSGPSWGFWWFWNLCSVFLHRILSQWRLRLLSVKCWSSAQLLYLTVISHS